jgi:hypothetical protein
LRARFCRRCDVPGDCQQASQGLASRNNTTRRERPHCAPSACVKRPRERISIPLAGHSDSRVLGFSSRLVTKAGLLGGDAYWPPPFGRWGRGEGVWGVRATRGGAQDVAAVGGAAAAITWLSAALVHEKAAHFCRRQPAACRQFQVGSLIQHFDAEAESEADEIAVRILRRAGFDPGAMEGVLRCIAAESSGGGRSALDVRIAHLARQPIRSESGRRTDAPGFTAARQKVGVDLGLTSGGSGARRDRTCR